MSLIPSFRFYTTSIKLQSTHQSEDSRTHQSSLAEHPSKILSPSPPHLNRPLTTITTHEPWPPSPRPHARYCGRSLASRWPSAHFPPQRRSAIQRRPARSTRHSRALEAMPTARSRISATTGANRRRIPTCYFSTSWWGRWVLLRLRERRLLCKVRYLRLRSELVRARGKGVDMQRMEGQGQLGCMADN